jgi:hypothetical protein
MKSIRSATALIGGLAICAALGACSGPGAAAPVASSLSSVAAAPTSLPMSAPQDAQRAGDVFESDVNAADEQTCDLFRQMVEGIDTLSTEEQQQLVIEMATAVQESRNIDLMRAVVDFGQGWLDDDPEQFAKGMRALSQICDVPYE